MSNGAHLLPQTKGCPAAPIISIANTPDGQERYCGSTLSAHKSLTTFPSKVRLFLIQLLSWETFSSLGDAYICTQIQYMQVLYNLGYMPSCVVQFVCYVHSQNWYVRLRENLLISFFHSAWTRKGEWKNGSKFTNLHDPISEYGYIGRYPPHQPDTLGLLIWLPLSNNACLRNFRMATATSGVCTASSSGVFWSARLKKGLRKWEGDWEGGRGADCPSFFSLWRRQVHLTPPPPPLLTRTWGLGGERTTGFTEFFQLSTGFTKKFDGWFQRIPS